MIIIHGIKLNTGESTELLASKAEQKLKLSKGSVREVKILKESIDAREKPRVFRVYSVGLVSEKPDEWLIKACKRHNVSFSQESPVKMEITPLKSVSETSLRPVIVGFGPCGMFAALALAHRGLKPVVLERGGCMQDRIAAVEDFWNGGRLDPECNVQFGEGGAGTFSDGKLTTGTRSPWAPWILEAFVRAGAPPEILFKQKPHIGTDILRKAVVNIRREIEDLGGEVRFGCRLEKLDIKMPEAAVRGLWYTDSSSQKEKDAEASEEPLLTYMPADCVILALGHSARDTVRALYGQGLNMEQKPFSMGVRIEHPQSAVDISQYGALHQELGLGPADYKLSVTTPQGRGVYTFCMCPGGYVVNSSSHPGMLVTNGMSNSGRDSGTANAALLANVLPQDYAPEYLPDGTDPGHPLAGMAFQEKYERLAFLLGGADYRAPVQSVGSFLGEDTSYMTETAVSPSFRPGTTPADISQCLPDFVSQALREALPMLGKKLKGFDDPKAVMTAVESRSSSPVRITRDPETLFAFAAPKDNGSAANTTIKGLYPAGEGAGYAGGIMSAAADGVRIAAKIAGK